MPYSFATSPTKMNLCFLHHKIQRGFLSFIASCLEFQVFNTLLISHVISTTQTLVEPLTSKSTGIYRKT